MMKIEFMRIENWRSFYGMNELWFSVDVEKNVTLIRAENGIGKTSLLAALNWCLFGILPHENDFKNPQNLVNDDAQANDNVTKTKVEVEFGHSDKVYKASRTFDQARGNTHSLKLIEIKDGVETPLPGSINADRFINSVLPREMAPHFFFYGEATSRYADEAGAEAFGSAVKNILGATVANMALKDLEKAFRGYSREAADNTGIEATELQKQIDEIEEKRDHLDERYKASKTEEHAAESLVEKLNKQLLGTAQVKKDQAQRNKLNSQLASARANLKRETESSQKWFGKYGTSLLARSFISDVKKLLDQEDTKKKIPGPYNERFVNDVLDEEMCICGRTIEHGSAEEAYVKSLLDTATDEIMINRVMSTSIALGRLEENSQNAWGDLEKSRTTLSGIQEQLSALDAELEEISDRLRNSEVSSIAEKEEALRTAKAKQRSEITQQATIKSTIDANLRRVEGLRREQEKLVRESLNAKRYVKRAQLSGELISRLSARLEEEELVARVEIKRKIDNIINQFMRKRLTVIIDKNYRLKVLDENKKLFAPSTGEKQMLGLAFTGAIADFAKDRLSEDTDILLSGTEAPLVVDSPFGHLDPTYRQGVANFLPQMASQVVLLVSTSQASEEVLLELDGKIGNQYVLTRYSSSDLGNRKEETVIINGKTVYLTKYNYEFTGTKIEEVS